VGDNDKNAEIGWGYLKIFSRANGQGKMKIISELQILRCVLT
jgi:hypothetical protein